MSKLVLVALGLLGLSLIILRDVLFLGGVYAERDLLSVYIPGVDAFVRAIAEGSLPLRDPSTAFGQPMLGNPDVQIPYPTTWLHLVMLPETAYPLVFLIHFLIAGTGAAALAWRISRSGWGSFLAGAFWLAAGPFQSFVSIVHHLSGAAWMPWVLTAFDRLLEETSPRRILVLSSVFGLQILAGSADMCALTLFLAGLRLLCEGFNASRSRLPAQLRAASASLIVALCLGTATWLSVGDVARFSSRGALAEEARNYWSIHPAWVAEFVMPLGLGSLNLVQAANDLLFEGREPFVKSLFVGPLILPFFLAALASPSVATSFRVFGGVGVFASLLVALGKYTWTYGLITTLLPVLSIFRYPSKGVIPASLLLCVLAGVGVSRLKGGRERRVAGTVTLLLLALHAIVFSWLPDVLPRLINSADLQVQRLARLHVGTELALSAAALLLLAASLAFRRPLGQILAASVGLIVTLAINSDLNPAVPRSVLRFRPDHVLAAVATVEPSRVYVSDYVFSPERSRRFLGRASPFADMKQEGRSDALATIVAYRSLLIPPVGGAWGVEYAWDTDLRGLFHLSLRDLTVRVSGLEGTPEFLRMLQIANVSRAVALHTSTFGQLQLERTIAMPTREPLYVFRVPETLPRAYAVSGVRVLANLEASRGILDPAFNPTAEVILDAGTPSAASATFKSTVVIASRRSDRIVLEATLNEPGVVVLLEGLLPGWRATVDGLSVPVRRANAFFVAVPVQTGNHRVVFTFRPWTAVLGLCLTALTATGLLIGLARPGKERVDHLGVSPKQT